jgi:hypothetical protein
MKRIKRRRRLKATSLKRGCGIVWILFVFVGFLVGAFTSMTSAAIFTKSINEIKNGTLETLGGVVSVFDSFSPAVAGAFFDIKVLVNSSIDETLGVIDFKALETTGLSPNLGNKLGLTQQYC